MAAVSAVAVHVAPQTAVVAVVLAAVVIVGANAVVAADDVDIACLLISGPGLVVHLLIPLVTSAL
jgi:hypothetical protein